MEPRDAATVMLVRDAHDTRMDGRTDGRTDGHSGGRPEGLEVFMLRRNLSSVFVAGAYVFPGGAVDPHDRSEVMAGLVHGLDDASASSLLGRPDGGLGFWVAAIRESFEEAGVLLARAAATDAPASPKIVDRLGPLRPQVAAGDVAFADVVRDADLVLDAACLRVFAHWITPSPAPRRYDTWFFLAPAPAGHAYRHDDDETIDSTWAQPADALARARRRELELIYPTYRCIEALSRFETTEALFAAVDEAWQAPEHALAPVEAHRAWQVRLPGDDEGGADRVADALAHSTTSHRRPAREAG